MTASGIVVGIRVAAWCALVAMTARNALVAAGLKVVCVVAAVAGTGYRAHARLGMFDDGFDRHDVRLFDRFDGFFRNVLVGELGGIGFGDRRVLHDGSVF